jgi:hypothetical protein
MANVDKLSDKQVSQAGVLTLSGTTAQTTNLTDMDGFEALTFVLQTGTVADAGTASGFTIKLQESDTTVDGDFTDVAAAGAVNGTTSITVTSDTDDNVPLGMLGYIGIKRYVRLSAVGTTGTDATFAAVGVKECARYAPPTATQTNVAAT